MCEYCNNARFKLKKCKLKIEQEVSSYKNDNFTREKIYSELEIDINYCPVCGRKVSD